MFKSKISRASRLPHLATLAAMMVTVAVSVMQSGTHTDAAPARTASVTTR